MGQKVNPVGLRLGVNRTWDSRWFADGADYGRLLHEDLKVRAELKKRLYQAGVSRIIIERPHKKCRITIYAARPGVIIGKKGADIEKLRKDVAAITGGEVHLNLVEIRKFIMKTLPQAAISKVVIERPAKLCRINVYAARPGVIIGKKGADIDKLKKQLSAFTSSEISLNIVEIRKPEVDAKLVAQGIADQLERRVAFRRAMKRAVQSAMRLGAEGIRINCAGRLGGAEIARTEWYREGRVPLHTLRANVDYAEAEAHTAYGVCGIKVWIFKGEIFAHDPMATDRLMVEAQTSGVRPAR